MTKTTHEHVRTLADLIRICQIDTDEWRVERWVANAWEMGSKDDHNRPQSTPLFQVKAWLVKNVELISVKAEVAALAVQAKASAVRRPWAVPQRVTSPYMLELSIPDLHAGKLAWGVETGHANYDSKIAEQVFEAALTTLLARVKSYTFKEILFTVGNDLLNTDNTIGTTTRGTQVESDVRFQKTFGMVRALMVRAIDRLRLIAPVFVPMVSGNHDELSVWHLGDSLECYYHKTPDVTIDNTPTLRKYKQFGKVMLMLTHGDKGKLQDYPLLMATEQPVMFGATVHHEAHTGHTHQLKVSEYHGVKVRVSPALCPPDAWHSANQFVGQGRSAEAFIWHAEEGLVGTAYYTVPAAYYTVPAA